MFGSIGAAIASAAGNLIGDTLGSGLNFLGSKNLQEDSQSWQRHILQNQKQWQVDDLIKAGLNPVLATGLNPAMPSGGTANFTGASFDGLRDSMASVRRMETQIAKENLKTAEASAESASAKALSDRIDADLKKDFWVNMEPNSRRLFYGQQMMGSSSAGQISGIAGQFTNEIMKKLNSFLNSSSAPTPTPAVKASSPTPASKKTVPVYKVRPSQKI